MDKDSALLLRQLQIYHVASSKAMIRPAFLLEHPTDPVVCNTKQTLSTPLCQHLDHYDDACFPGILQPRGMHI